LLPTGASDGDGRRSCRKFRFLARSCDAVQIAVVEVSDNCIAAGLRYGTHNGVAATAVDFMKPIRRYLLLGALLLAACATPGPETLELACRGGTASGGRRPFPGAGGGRGRRGGLAVIQT
jgi:hypothetical protein